MMRRSIGYTGRKKLARSHVEVKLDKSDTGKRVTLTLVNQSEFESLPSSSRVKLRLFENHVSESLMFGTLGEVSQGVGPLELMNHEAFSAPSVQLRVVEAEGDRRGLILGSTSRWTLRMKGKDKEGDAKDGILWLQSRDIAPRIWALNVRDDEHPIVYIDSKIRNPYDWARSDAIFASCVLPAIVRELFDEIFREHQDSEQQWVTDWLNWAEALVETKLEFSADDNTYKEWINDLIHEFCLQHNLLDKLISRLEEDHPK